MELHKVCRICLKNDLLVSIYSPAFLLRPIEMIEKLNICKIDDSLPKFLCQSCLYRLLDAYNLQELANASMRQLCQYLGTEMTMQAEAFSIKKNERTSFSSFCDIFQSHDIETTRRVEEDVTDDMLNDIEIDVSSLTRSEADDTLSEVFVDAQINCHYETETNSLAENIITNDAEYVIQPPLNEETVEIETANQSVKRKTVKMAEKCLECGKTFKTTGYLALHKRIHTGERPFKCKLCPRHFVQKSNLHLHQRVHSGERPMFQCEICASFFTTLSNLKAHGVVHMDTRDFQCEICQKRFKSSRELRRHEPVHDSIKQHKCNLCEKSFSKQSYLGAHMLTLHRNAKKHKCKDCCKVFASKSNLKCHMRIHSGEKPFECTMPQCEWKFNQSSALLRHIQKKHANSKQFEKIGDKSAFEKEKSEKPDESTDFEFQVPPAPNGINSNINGAPEHLNQTYIPIISASNYDYNKIVYSFYARNS